jgi:hypothetical protein
MRVNAVERCCAQRGHFNAHSPPFFGAAQAQQLAQRGHAGWRVGHGITPGMGAGLAHVGRAAQGHAVVGFQWHQKHAQHPCTLGLRLPVLVKGLRCARCGLGGFQHCFASFALRHGIAPAGHGLQQLAGVEKIALPQHGGTCAGVAVGLVGGSGVVGHHNALGRGCTAL